MQRKLAALVFLSVFVGAACTAANSSEPTLTLSDGYELELAAAESLIDQQFEELTQLRYDNVWLTQKVLDQEQRDLERFYQLVVDTEASQPATESVQVPRSTGGSVGDCSGFVIPDYIIQRESGGNPHAVNPSSGAYGCAQTMQEHYSANGWGSGPGACYGLDMTNIDHQRECVNILSNGGTNLNPWAETR